MPSFLQPSKGKSPLELHDDFSLHGSYTPNLPSLVDTALLPRVGKMEHGHAEFPHLTPILMAYTKYLKIFFT